ncbi:small ribosomal subunit protein mL103 (rPPR7)-like [Phragmites australis]|uniref:small ribosomal subunit protein mL103 (rPPR7)-like n=1 Tax=Phragmites australis TaxID=29695 RepID=UPI002D766264|nr:small ribosomal subunit protein mL103 (rPPR7)-like [Phragmites australis]
MAAAIFSTGRRLLSTAAAAVGEAKTEYPIPIAHLRRLVRAGRLADIDAVLAPLFPSHPVAALSALSAVGLPDRASALLATIPSPTAAHLNAVLGPLLLRRRLAGLVPSILAAHPSAPRDAITDSILAKSLCIISGADSALHLLREPSSGAAPSLQLFTAIIDSFYKQRLPHRAEELWRSMVDDHGITPDAAAYNARITYKSTNGTVEEVRELIHIMREETGLRPDVITYNALMRAMVRHGRVDEALEVYRSLEKGEEVEVVPDCGTYTCVVSALCGAGRWSEAEDVFYEGLKRRKVSDLGTVRRLVRGLKDAGKGRAARRVVVGLRKKFPDQFDGPWRELEEVAGLPASGKEDDYEDGDDEQPVATTAAA